MEQLSRACLEKCLPLQALPASAREDLLTLVNDCQNAPDTWEKHLKDLSQDLNDQCLAIDPTLTDVAQRVQGLCHTVTQEAAALRESLAPERAVLSFSLRNRALSRENKNGYHHLCLTLAKVRKQVDDLTETLYALSGSLLQNQRQEIGQKLKLEVLRLAAVLTRERNAPEVTEAVSLSHSFSDVNRRQSEHLTGLLDCCEETLPHILTDFTESADACLPAPNAPDAPGDPEKLAKALETLCQNLGLFLTCSFFQKQT